MQFIKFNKMNPGLSHLIVSKYQSNPKFLFLYVVDIHNRYFQIRNHNKTWPKCFIGRQFIIILFNYLIAPNFIYANSNMYLLAEMSQLRLNFTTEYVLDHLNIWNQNQQQATAQNVWPPGGMTRHLALHLETGLGPGFPKYLSNFLYITF